MTALDCYPARGRGKLIAGWRARGEPRRRFARTVFPVGRCAGQRATADSATLDAPSRRLTRAVWFPMNARICGLYARDADHAPAGDPVNRVRILADTRGTLETPNGARFHIKHARSGQAAALRIAKAQGACKGTIVAEHPDQQTLMVTTPPAHLLTPRRRRSVQRSEAAHRATRFWQQLEVMCEGLREGRPIETLIQAAPTCKSVAARHIARDCLFNRSEFSNQKCKWWVISVLSYRYLTVSPQTYAVAPSLAASVKPGGARRCGVRGISLQISDSTFGLSLQIVIAPVRE